MGGQIERDGDTSARRRLLSQTGCASRINYYEVEVHVFWGAFDLRSFWLPVELDWIMKQ